MKDIAKFIGTGISIITLLLSLISSWTYFYSEQKINSMKMENQEKISDRHSEELRQLFTQQNKLVEIVSYNSKDIQGVQGNIEKLIEMQQRTQVYITKIATKVGVDK